MLLITILMEPLVGLAPSVRTRPPYEFTKLALLLLRHRGGKWRPRQELHLRPAPSQGAALIYLSYADNLR